MNDWFMAVSLMILAGMCYFLLYREKRHKEIILANRKELFLFKSDNTYIQFLKDISSLPIEQRLRTLYYLFGKDRVIRANFRIYESGCQLNAIYVDDDDKAESDSKEAKSKKGYIR